MQNELIEFETKFIKDCSAKEILDNFEYNKENINCYKMIQIITEASNFLDGKPYIKQEKDKYISMSFEMLKPNLEPIVLNTPIRVKKNA